MKKGLSLNATIAVTQVLVTGVILFIVYRYLVTTLGIESVGIWSVVVAVASLARIAQLGISGSVVKYVAKYKARSDMSRVAGIVETGALSTFVLIAIAAIIGYPVVLSLLDYFIDESNLELAKSVTPFVLVSVWLGGLSNVFSAGLDGCQRIDYRGYLVSIGGMVFLAAVLMLVPDYGLKGLVYAYVIQNIYLVVFGWIVLRSVLPELHTIPIKWGRSEFREMLNYGINYQIVSITQLLYEPTTKLLITYFGGLAVTGYYEMANRMVLQFRAILVAGNQVMVPYISEKHEDKSGDLVGIYRKSYDLTFFISVPYFSIIIAYTPVISSLWIGQYEEVFVLASIVLSIAWWINSLCSPAYFSYLGTGFLRRNVLVHIVIAIANILLGVLLGINMEVYGPILGWFFALCIGSMMMLVLFHMENSIPMLEILPRKSRLILSMSVLASVICLYIHYRCQYDMSILNIAGANLTLFIVLLLPIVWKHPITLWAAKNILKA